MLHKRHLLSLLIVCCLFVFFAGCRDKDDAEETPEGAVKTGVETPVQTEANTALPEEDMFDPFEVKPPAAPTEAELNSLGPVREENRELLRYMSDNPSSFTVIHPARVIQTPYLIGHQDAAEPLVSQIFVGFNRFFPTPEQIGQIPFSNIRRMSFCSSIMKQKPAYDMMTGQSSQRLPNELPTTVCVLELNEPVDDLTLLSLFNPFGNVAIEMLTPVTVNGMKTYDMVPPTTEAPLMERLVFVTPTTVVFASGNVSEVTKVFDSEPSQGAIPSRVLRTDMQNGDLIALYSAEGIVSGFVDMLAPYLMAKRVMMQFQGQEMNPFMEYENAFLFARKLKHMAIRMDLQSAEAGNILQADMELLSATDAEPLKKSMETPISDFTNGMSLLVAQIEAQAQMPNVPTEQQEAIRERLKNTSFLITTFDQLKVNASGTKLSLTLAKVPGFDTAFGDMLTPIFAQYRITQAVQKDVDSMRRISMGIDTYLQLNDRRYPNFAMFGQDGTPLLSWRVAILPFIGKSELFNRFHLNEPWNSEHNRTLIAEIPDIYADPSGQAPAGTTLFRMIGGEGSFLSRFPNGFSVSDLTFPQGTLYMFTVRPEQAVEWTRPEYLQYDPNTFAQIVKEFPAMMFCTGDVGVEPLGEIMASGELPYWVAGTMSPRVAEIMEARQRVQQYEQMIQPNNPAMAPQPLPDNPMSTGPPMQTPQPPPIQTPMQPPPGQF